MAVIECVFDYDKKTGDVTQVIHVREIDTRDKIFFVSPAKGLTLECMDKQGFPPMNLKEGDLAPLAYTKALPTKRGAHELVIYYHGPVGHFNCKYVDGDGKKYEAKGVTGPGGGPG
jgi:hypothetical protein